jgi:septum formation protein
MLENFTYKIILGSASPRRQELLKTLNLSFEVCPINANEEFPEKLKREEIPLFLAEKKSNAFQQSLKDNELLITSDTIVWHDGHVLNKPLSYFEALSMLSELSGNFHEVFTGVCLRTNKFKEIFSDSTKVYFRKLEEEEIEYYVKKYNVYDKAGGYGAQDWIGNVAIERIEGSYFNVMGLPVHKLYSALKRINSL